MNQEQRGRVDAATQEIHDIAGRVSARLDELAALRAEDADDEARVANLEAAVASLASLAPEPERQE